MAARAPLALWPAGRGLQVVRPLLGERRARMRTALREARADWVEDPANALDRYTRVRARARLAAWDHAGAERWAALAVRFAALAAVQDRDARACLAEALRVEGDAAEVSLGRLGLAPQGAQLRALGVLIAAVAGAEREPPEAAVARLLETGGTLGGAWVRRRGAALTLLRDPGAVRGRSGVLAPLALAPGLETVWDGRLAVTVVEPGWSIGPDSQGEGEGTAPVLRQGCSQLTLIEAETRGLARSNWLIGERIAHLLWR
jgi:tRNA(Ile)-lysidine synthase